MKSWFVFSCGLAVAMSVSSVNAFVLTGKVYNPDGAAVKGASVSLPDLNLSTTSDGVGAFTLRDTPLAVGSGVGNVPNPGFISVHNGVLSYAQSATGPVQVQIFDAMGFRVVNRTLYGAGEMDLRGFVNAEGTYFARVRMGSALQNLKFTARGTYGASLEMAAQEKNEASLRKMALLKDGSGSNLQVVADGFDTLNVVLTNLDTNVVLNLVKSSSAGDTGNAGDNGASEQKYAFGYALKNAATPSKGCGKNSTLVKAGDVENGSRYTMTVAGLEREFFITMPANYDNTKPYKILFANHCMGSNAEDFVHHEADQDHPSPYYGQQALDTEGDYIFVAPHGDTDGMPWRTGDDKDHQFFDQLLTTMEENYCIDTSRVFVTGFSFGSMYSNSLAQVFQHRIRAVVTYAVADWNIYIPDNAGKPIAWMDVHGIDDNLCSYSRLNSSITRILKNNGPDGTDVSSEVDQMERYTKDMGATHVCYSFKQVDPRFPVQVCTWNGGHQWTANDNGGWQNTWVPQKVHEFFEQF